MSSSTLEFAQQEIGSKVKILNKNFLPKRVISILAALVFCMVLQHVSEGFLNSFVAGLVFNAAIYVTLAVSLNLINGITGQFSIGHFAFFQIGAYTAAAVSKGFYAHQGLAPLAWIFLMTIAGGIIAALAGLFVGLPSLRLRGDYLAIVTLGFGEIIRIASENITYVEGAKGIDVKPQYQSIFLAALLAIVCVAVCRNILKTVFGLGFLSIREDEVAATAMGVNVTNLKVLAFVIGSCFAGGAGALYAHRFGFIIPDQFKMDGSFMILTMVIFGGTGSITGSVFAAITLFFLPELLRDLTAVPVHSLLGSGIGIIVATYFTRQVIAKHYSAGKEKTIAYTMAIVKGIAAGVVCNFLLAAIPKIASQKPIDGSQLRMVIFPVVLIVLMLLRPQGVFADHEFSWKWLFGTKLFSKLRKAS